jgi:ribonuclease-3
MFTLIEQKIGYVFKNKQLLTAALHHSSLKRNSLKFERLEFLGDRVLGLVIAEILYKKLKNTNEGDMARKLASLVSSGSCQKIALVVGIDKCIKTANDKILRINQTVLADAIEAIIGAIFLDGGFVKARNVVIRLWSNMVENTDTTDPKTQLQEITQNRNGSIPKYVVISKIGLEHEPHFTVEVQALGFNATGTGSSKKIAEVEAARKILEIIEK